MIWITLFIVCGLGAFFFAMPVGVSGNRRAALWLWWGVALLTAVAVALVIDLASNPALYHRMFGPL